jgi:hypothetical protein
VSALEEEHFSMAMFEYMKVFEFKLLRKKVQMPRRQPLSHVSLLLTRLRPRIFPNYQQEQAHFEDSVLLYARLIYQLNVYSPGIATSRTISRCYFVIRPDRVQSTELPAVQNPPSASK